jgi:hypothetical protein
MNRTSSTRVSTHSAYGRVCAISMLVMLTGLCLVIGGVTFDIVLLRYVGLGTFVIAASVVLAMVLVAQLLDRRS